MSVIEQLFLTLLALGVLLLGIAAMAGLIAIGRHVYLRWCRQRDSNWVSLEEGSDE